MAGDWKIVTLVVTLSLFHVIAGSSNRTDNLDWGEEGNAFVKLSAESYTPEKSGARGLRNKQTSIHSLLSKFSKRGSHSSPCRSESQRKDPRQFFNTADEFFPRSYTEKKCTGTPGPRGPPSCGGGFMDCVTQTKTLYFMRKPKSSSNCPKWFRAKIKNVLVDCDCMWPY